MPYFEETQAGELRQAFGKIVHPWPGVTSKKMFGAPSFAANGTLFAVIVTGGLILTRLGDEEKATLLEDPAVEYFTGHGRVIRKWLFIAIKEPADLERYLPFIEASYREAAQQ